VARHGLDGISEGAARASLASFLGRLADARGRKLGTVLFAAFYAASALSTRSPLLWILFAGRVCGGLGTALLSAAPEAWVVGDAIRTNTTGVSLFIEEGRLPTDEGRT
jgi:MFS family permease